MQTVAVRLTPWAERRIIENYGAVNKTNLRQSLRDLPGTEFHTIGTPALGIPAGKVLTVSEAQDAGFDQIEVRYGPHEQQVAIIVPEPRGSGQVVVR